MRAPLAVAQSSRDGVNHLTWAVALQLSQALLGVELGTQAPHHLPGRRRRRLDQTTADSDTILDFLRPPRKPASTDRPLNPHLRQLLSHSWRRRPTLSSAERDETHRHYRTSTKSGLSAAAHSGVAPQPLQRRLASSDAHGPPRRSRSFAPTSPGASAPRAMDRASPIGSRMPRQTSTHAQELMQRAPEERSLPHWTATIVRITPGTGYRRESHALSAQLNDAMDKVRKIPQRVSHNLRKELSRGLGEVWDEYIKVCHDERLPILTRVKVGRLIVSTLRMIKVQKQSYPNIIGESNEQGHRLTALVHDCELFSELAQEADRDEDIDRRTRLAIDNLRAQSHALLGEDIAAKNELAHILEEHHDALLAALADDSPVGNHMDPLEANDIEESMSAMLDAAITRDQTLRYKASRSIRSATDDLDPAAQKVPQQDQDGGWVPTKSRQAALLHWLLKYPHALALISRTGSRIAGKRFRELLSVVEDPVTMLQNVVGDASWQDLGPSALSTQLVLAFAEADDHRIGIDVYRAATDSGARIDERVARRLLRMSAWTETNPFVTESLIRLIMRNVKRAVKRGWRTDRQLSDKTLATIAIFRARHAHIDKMEIALAELEKRGTDPQLARAVARRARMESIIARGDVQACRAELAKLYHCDGDKPRDVVVEKLAVDRIFFQTLLRCCANADDVKSAVSFWDEMLQSDIVPDAGMFNTLLDLFSRSTDVEAALQLVETMREWGVRPTKHTFTNLVSLFALRKDTEGAIYAIKAMKAEGLEPNRYTWTALLNAYVNSSSWDAAIGLFRWMQKNPKRSLRPDLAAYTTLLKAYVLRSVPIQTVMSTAAEMRSLGIEWDPYTFSLVMQSAVDAGLMDVAEEVFSQAEKRLMPAPGLRWGQGADLYHFTIMINGYLRLGNTEEAKEYFNELQDRGIEPSPITWSAIISSYANSESDDNFQLARTLVTQLVKDESVKGLHRAKWKSPALRQGPPYESMFMPLVIAHGQRGEPDEAEKTTESLMQTGSGVSIQILTALLDAYRRSGEIHKAVQLFDTLYAQVVADTTIDLSRMDANPESSKADLEQRRQDIRGSDFSLGTSYNVDPARRAMLCIPISIMIDLYSNAGLHDEVAALWSRAKKDGFAFDPHNWNHLAAAMARADRLEEGLTVIEQVLYNAVPDYRGRRKRNENLDTIPVDEFGAPVPAAETGMDNTRTKGEGVKEAAGADTEAEASDEDGGERLAQEVDPLSTTGLYPVYLYAGDDMTPSPSAPPNRRHEHRYRDDPYAPLPFDSDEDITQPLEDDFDIPESLAPTTAEPEVVKTERQKEREKRRRKAAMRNMTKHLLEQNKYELSFNPWFAHFETLQALSDAVDRALDEGEAGHERVNDIMARHDFAASLLARHRRRVDDIEEAKRLEAERSARFLIDRPHQ